MTAKTWFIAEHTFAALLLVVAFATACGQQKPIETPASTTEKAESVFAGQANRVSRSFEVVRVRVEDRGWLYITVSSASGGVAQVFIPDGK